MKLTYYGHSCFSVEAGGKTLLFDPFITPNPLASGINVDEIKADYILVSHGHYDHTTDVIRIARRTGAKVLGNWELNDWFNKSGLQNTHPINPGGQVEFEFGKVKCVNAVHSSSLADGSYAGTASGFVIKSMDGSFYYSGDTGLTLDMQLIVEWALPSFAILPIGDCLTMGVDDAIKAAQWLGVKHVVGVHYDTFGFIKIDHEKAMASFNRADLTLHLLPIGSAIDL
jgi:L-ascorbate metabolism protein UlaG (beta-lactamase superfamily)